MYTKIETNKEFITPIDFGCPYCWDKKKDQSKPPLYFFDAANNLRLCNFCPNCGRKYEEEDE